MSCLRLRCELRCDVYCVASLLALLTFHLAVADFRGLVAATDRSPKLAERVIAALGLQKGWEDARRHALVAVQPDFLLR